MHSSGIEGLLRTGQQPADQPIQSHLHAVHYQSADAQPSHHLSIANHMSGVDWLVLHSESVKAMGSQPRILESPAFAGRNAWPVGACGIG